MRPDGAARTGSAPIRPVRFDVDWPPLWTPTAIAGVDLFRHGDQVELAVGPHAGPGVDDRRVRRRTVVFTGGVDESGVGPDEVVPGIDPAVEQPAACREPVLRVPTTPKSRVTRLDHTIAGPVQERGRGVSASSRFLTRPAYFFSIRKP